MSGNNRQIVLENQKVRFVFGKGSGCLESLLNKIAGRELISFKPGSRLFKLIYPVEDIRSHSFESELQTVSSHKLQTKGKEQVLNLYYDNLVSERGSFQVQVEVECRLPQDSDELLLKMEIKNEDRGEVSQVYFPLVGGLQEISDEPSQDKVVMPVFGGSVIRDPLHTLPGKGQGLGFNEVDTIRSIFYPGGGSMQWMDFFCKTHGLFLTCLNKSGEFLVLWMKKEVWDAQEHLYFSAIKYPYLQTGKSWSSSLFMISAHSGDWHTGADKYRTWLKTWLGKQDSPEWLKKTNGFFHTMGRLSDGTTMNEIEELPGIYKEAKEHGIDLIFHCGWYKEGHDGRHPDYAPIDADKLKRNYAEIHEEKGHLLLYVNGSNYCTSNPGWEKEGKVWAVKRTEGKRGPVETTDGRLLPLQKYGSSPAFGFSNAPAPLHWEWSFDHYPSFEGETVAVMCPSCSGWVEKILQAVERAAKLGADVVILDTISMHAALCFDEEHEHSTYDSAWGPGWIKIFRKALHMGRAINPDFSLCVEGICDIYTPYIGIFHSRITEGKRGPGGVDANAPEVFLYTLPWATGITGTCIDMGDYDRLHQSFLLGLSLDVEIHTHARGRFSYDPELAQAIKTLNRLRTEHTDLFVEGTFRDDVGLVWDKGNVVCKLFLGKEAVGVTLWNQSKKVEDIHIQLLPSKIGRQLQDVEATLCDGLTSRRVSVEKGKNLGFILPKIKANSVCLLVIEPISKV